MKFEPLYLRVKEQLREDFRAAQVEYGLERLPSLNDLQTQYQVSRPTISKALAALAAEGLLVKEAGRGTFALAPASSPPGLFGLPSRLTIGYIAPVTEAELPQYTFRGVDRVAHRRNCRVLMASARSDVANERVAVREMVAAGASGLIIYPTVRNGVPPERDYLRHEDLGVPVVLVDTCTPEQGHTQVIFDNRRAGRQMTEWLIKRGHRRIGLIFIDEEVHHPSLEARLRGYREALRDHGLSGDDAVVQRLPMDGTQARLGLALDTLLALPQPPTALIALDDHMAMEVIETLAHRGIHVPDQMYVAGFDNAVAARRYQPAFATTQPDFEAMGEVACEMLLDGIESGSLPTQTYILPVPLLIRSQAHRHLPRTDSRLTLNGANPPTPASADVSLML